MFKGILLLIIVGGLVFGAWWYQDNIKYTNVSAAQIIIQPNESMAEIGAALAQAQLVKSALAFKIYFRLNAGRELVAGTYSFPVGSTIQDITSRLGRGQADEDGALSN